MRGSNFKKKLRRKLIFCTAKKKSHFFLVKMCNCLGKQEGFQRRLDNDFYFGFTEGCQGAAAGVCDLL